MFPRDLMMTALYAALAVFFATGLLGLWGIPLIRRKISGQPIRDNGPASHKAKAGTPTFGGLLFMLPLMALALAAPLISRDLWPLSLLISFMVLFGLIGLADDYVKVRVTRKGMSVKQKTLLLGLASLLASVTYLWLLPAQPFILVPFTARVIAVRGGWKLLYLVFLVPFLFYMSNSVNITDGLDGLLSSLMAIASSGLLVIGGLLAPLLPLAGPLVTLTAAMAAGCLAFLYFNRYPARIFMGDTGSQALGIGFSLATVFMGVPYLALITGFVFFFEGLSVVIQVLYFKATGGRRIFRMSPIHHHFELLGWHETRVAAVFRLAGLLCAVLGILTMAGPLLRR
ncbi:MAG: phospho-N-acetylmuramoyl-pentapeptide-transferase [Saccharofermentanales bacterium]